MVGRRLVGLFLLLWMAVTVSGQEDLINQFVHDIISTFNLTLPTVLYDSDEPPQICYENTPERRLLCLLATEQEQKIDSGLYVQGSNHVRVLGKAYIYDFIHAQYMNNLHRQCFLVVVINYPA